ncbi:MAG: hypothetical protein PHT94_04695, partial [Candidatus Nanoarchaeia archaeon]|nr:hypothetical protein [Candidatus Nanoarchaeia archaeon]
EAIKTKDYITIRDASDKVIHNASIYQDNLSIGATVIIYATSKLLKMNYRFVQSNILPLFEKCYHNIEEEQEERVIATYNTITKMIKNEDKNLNKFYKEILDDADLKKVTKIYDHGISLRRASSILNVSEWEALSFLGASQVVKDDDNQNLKKYVKNKLEYTRELFKN